MKKKIEESSKAIELRKQGLSLKQKNCQNNTKLENIIGIMKDEKSF